MITQLVHMLAPAAAATGSGGLPLPDPMDAAAVLALPRGRAAVLGPADMSPAPTIVLPELPVPAEELYAMFLRLADDRPLLFLAAAYPTRLQAHFVARSARRNLPTVIAALALPRGGRASAALVHASAVYGPGGRGGCRRLLRDIAAALQAQALAQTHSPQLHSHG